MLEKSSTIVLTQNDLDEFHLGVVSTRLTNLWGLSYQELKDLVAEGNYTLA